MREYVLSGRADAHAQGPKCWMSGCNLGRKSTINQVQYYLPGMYIHDVLHGVPRYLLGYILVRVCVYKGGYGTRNRV